MEIKKIWHLKTTTVPVIVGDLGMTKKETDKHISEIPGSLSQYEIPKKYTLSNYSFSYESTINVSENITQKRQQKI